MQWNMSLISISCGIYWLPHSFLVHTYLLFDWLKVYWKCFFLCYYYSFTSCGVFPNSNCATIPRRKFMIKNKIKYAYQATKWNLCSYNWLDKLKRFNVFFFRSSIGLIECSSYIKKAASNNCLSPHSFDSKSSYYKNTVSDYSCSPSILVDNRSSVSEIMSIYRSSISEIISPYSLPEVEGTWSIFSEPTW